MTLCELGQHIKQMVGKHEPDLPTLYSPEVS